MYGDSETIRRRARQLRDQGADVRALADELVARVEGLGWTGRAADALRERVTERAHHLRVAAERHVGAADALRTHAARVDEIRDEIAATRARVTTLVADARARIAVLPTPDEPGAGPAVAPDPLDEALAAFTPPPEGHRDWLTVEVPGLER
ncbi:WXG100 family type VII secretion target [Nocardioides sp. R1-1]|uniref:WXG100 family type VII secretion target n=1 Tax=Nocardioides sp. R1-1 TaxID=3383502 RepID=UPI0038CF975F